MVGGNKVHTEEGHCRPRPKNRICLGNHPNIFEAIAFARKKGYPKANPCFWCAREARPVSNEHLNEYLPSNIDPNLKSIIVEDFKNHNSILHERGELNDTLLLTYSELSHMLSRTFAKKPFMPIR